MGSDGNQMAEVFHVEACANSVGMMCLSTPCLHSPAFSTIGNVSICLNHIICSHRIFAGWPQAYTDANGVYSMYSMTWIHFSTKEENKMECFDVLKMLCALTVCIKHPPSLYQGQHCKTNNFCVSRATLQNE